MSWYKLWSASQHLDRWLHDLVYCVLQSLQNVLWGFGNLRFFIPPQLAETIVATLHRGVKQGSDDPQAIRMILWACAALGYVPSTRMLQDFKVT